MQRSLPALNPKTYLSPSGEYALSVNPDDPQGSGGARYRLSRKGVVVWEGARPFTLWEAVVTDTGVVGGYAYSSGWQGWDRNGGYGAFLVLILDDRGRERLHLKVKRVGSRFLHTPPQPMAAGLILDGAQERLVVRVADADLNRRAEEWWVFQLSTGREVRRLTPKKGMGSFEAAQLVLAARCVVGTPLVLLHWWRFDAGTRSLGARFTLIDLDHGSPKPVWVLDLPRDYNVPQNEAAQDRLRDEIGKTGAILPSPAHRQLTLRFVAQKQRVTFQVDGEKGGRWRVTKARSVPDVPPPPLPKKEEPSAPVILLTLRDRLDLLAAAGSGAPQSPNLIERPFPLIAVGQGRLAFIRREKESALVVVTQQGEVLHTVPLDRLRGSESRDAWLDLKLVWQGEARFIVFCERRADDRLNTYTEAYRVDALTGAISALAGFRCPPIEAVAAFPGGGFVVLATVHVKYTSKDEVYAYDGDGRRAWALTRGFGYGPNEGPEKLFSPQSLTVLRDGSVAVLGGILHTVQLYNRNGRYLRTVALKAAWKREPSYPTQIVSDPDGGFLVHDFDGTPPLIWMKGNGSVLRSFTPRYESGLPIEILDLCISSGGRLWVSDGYSLLGLDASGRATARVGAPPNANRLGEIGDVAIQTGGRILLVDARTGAVHVLDAKGRRLHICLPRRGAAEASTSVHDGKEHTINLGPNDTFALGEDWFGADGKPQNKPLGFVTAQERSRLVRRRADGMWLGWVRAYASAPNGALALQDAPRVLSSDDGPSFVSLYSATNAPERTLLVPRSLGSWVVMAYDGIHVVLSGGGWAYCYRAATGQLLWRFAPPAAPKEVGKPAEERYWKPFLTDAGQTLCLYDGERFLYRYAMP